MNPAPNPPAEKAMLLIVRLWFIWPLVCLVSAVIASPFTVQIQTGNSWGQWMYFTWLCTLAVACLFLLVRAAFTSAKSIQNPGFRRQGFIVLAMIGLFFCIMFPLGLGIAIIGFGAF